MSVPAELRYTPEHEWVSVEGDSASVGITEYAAQQLGDVVLHFPAGPRRDRHGRRAVRRGGIRQVRQ